MKQSKKSKKGDPQKSVDMSEFEGLVSFQTVKSYNILKCIDQKGKKIIKEEQRKNAVSNSKVKKKNVKKKINEQQVSKSVTTNNGSIKSVKDNISYNNPKEKKHYKNNSVNRDSWNAIHVSEVVINAIQELKFIEPTPIQKYTIPAGIKGRKDIIGAAETGSGKTLAFMIPIIDGVLEDKKKEESKQQCEVADVTSESDSEDFSATSESMLVDDDQECGIGCVNVVDGISSGSSFDIRTNSHSNKISGGKLKALVITPTRELAVQIQRHTQAIIAKTSIKCALVIGGLSMAKQERLLNRRPDIVIGTPGRLWEMFQYSHPHLNQIPFIRYLAIDEADRLLEKGHFEELKNLLEIINSDEKAKTKRQTFVFSATLTMTHAPPKRIGVDTKVKKVSKEVKLENLIKIIGVRDRPKIVDITRKFGTAESLSESKVFCEKEEKDSYLYYFLSRYRGRTLVFCNSINCVRRLNNVLKLLQCNVKTLYASKKQKQRLKNLERFTSEASSILLATDVAARGIDIPNVDHILHYEVPPTAETYVHRSGRTARASKEGVSVLLVSTNEVGKYKKMCETLNRSCELASFPIDFRMLEEAKKRVDLAKSIEKSNHAMDKKSSDESWFKKMAQEAEIELSESENDDEEMFESNMKKQKFKAENVAMKAQLNSLLRQPISRVDFSNNFSNLTNTTSTGSKNKKAIELIRNKEGNNLVSISAHSKPRFKKKRFHGKIKKL